MEDKEFELFVVDGFLGGLYDWRGLVFNVKRYTFWMSQWLTKHLSKTKWL